jgi:hypothetical protein
VIVIDSAVMVAVFASRSCCSVNQPLLLVTAAAAVTDPLAPGSERGAEVLHHVEHHAAAAVTGPGPADKTVASLLSLRERRLDIHRLAIVLRAEFADHQRQGQIVECLFMAPPWS